MKPRKNKSRSLLGSIVAKLVSIKISISSSSKPKRCKNSLVSSLLINCLVNASNELAAGSKLGLASSIDRLVKFCTKGLETLTSAENKNGRNIPPKNIAFNTPTSSINLPTSFCNSAEVSYSPLKIFS